MQEVIKLQGDVKRYALIHSNGEDVSALFDTVGDATMDANELIQMMANGMVCAANSICLPDESVMEVYIKLLDYLLVYGSLRWGDVFGNAVESYKLTGEVGE